MPNHFSSATVLLERAWITTTVPKQDDRMLKQSFTSELLQSVVDELSTLPGVGKKSALRFALHLLKQPKENVEKFGSSVIRMRNEIQYCTNCNMISDSAICPVCSDKKRDTTLVCVVESIRDVLSIENTG